MVIAQDATYGERTTGGYHEKDCPDCLASTHRDGIGLPATRLLVGSSVVRPRGGRRDSGGGCRGRGGAPRCRHRRPGVRVFWTTSCLRLSPAYVRLPSSGLWVFLLRTAVLFCGLWVPWLLRGKRPLRTPVVDRDKSPLSPVPDQKGARLGELHFTQVRCTTHRHRRKKRSCAKARSCPLGLPSTCRC